MSYTIIGQNNSVTTIDDGNGHTLHVPSRVALAIGTTFTITEVNNNMATLTDSNGKVYRDIPCVVDLVGSGGGGGSSLPDQTGHAGEFLTTDGTDASWSDKPLVNTAPDSYGLTILGTAVGALSEALNIGAQSSAGTSGVAVGYKAKTTNNNSVSVGANTNTSGFGGVSVGDSAKNVGYGVSVGRGAETKGQYSTAVGYNTQTGSGASYAIQIGCADGGAIVTNSDANTFKVANANGNFEIMSADGTIPTARLTKVNSTITLTSAGWSSNTQTVNVTGMTATGVVFVSPDPTDQSAYTSAGIYCTAQAAGTLTFTCDTVPSGDIDVNVVML